MNVILTTNLTINYYNYYAAKNASSSKGNHRDLGEESANPAASIFECVGCSPPLRGGRHQKAGAAAAASSSTAAARPRRANSL